LREDGIGTIGDFRDLGAVAVLRRARCRHASIAPGLRPTLPSFHG
jgi:hypothetical protein